MIWPLLLVAAASGASSNNNGVIGSYRIEQMEMGGGLELEANGRFRYALSYGAADEVAEGDWKLEGGAVRLTSKPTPRSPAYEVSADTPGPPCRLQVKVDWGTLNWSGQPDLFVGYSGDAELQSAPVDDNGDVQLTQCGVDTLLLLVPVYGTPTKAIRIDPANGHALSLRFIANDVGRAAFDGQPLRIDGDDLLMERFATKIRFVRNRL